VVKVVAAEVRVTVRCKVEVVIELENNMAKKVKERGRHAYLYNMLVLGNTALKGGSTGTKGTNSN
jgi:hypothetical protein